MNVKSHFIRGKSDNTPPLPPPRRRSLIFLIHSVPSLPEFLVLLVQRVANFSFHAQASSEGQFAHRVAGHWAIHSLGGSAPPSLSQLWGRIGAVTELFNHVVIHIPYNFRMSPEGLHFQEPSHQVLS